MQASASTALEKLDFPSGPCTAVVHRTGRQPSFAGHTAAVAHTATAGRLIAIRASSSSSRFACRERLRPSSSAAASVVANTIAAAFAKSTPLSSGPSGSDPSASASFTAQPDHWDPSSSAVANTPTSAPQSSTAGRPSGPCLHPVRPSAPLATPQIRQEHQPSAVDQALRQLLELALVLRPGLYSQLPRREAIVVALRRPF